MGDLLTVRGLILSFGGVRALDDVGLDVVKGSIAGLIGPNGAGKSSTLRAIAGLCRPSRSEVWLKDKRIDGWSTEKVAREGLSFVPDTRDLFPRLTVAENLRLGSIGLRGRDFASRRAEALLLFPALERLLSRQAWTHSGGEQQMLALARALLARPRLLLLGLAPLAVRAIFDALARVVASGTSLLVVEQTTAAALSVADYAYVIRNGRIALEGTSESLKDDPRVLDLYLGSEEGM